MKLSKAIEGYLLDSSTTHAVATVYLRKAYLGMFCEYAEDPDLTSVTSDDLARWLAYLKNDYVPHRFPSAKTIGPLSPSALDNHWKSLRSFFGWCERKLKLPRPDLSLQKPKYKLPEVVPFTQEQMTKLFTYATNNFADGETRKYKMSRPTGLRDVVILTLLIETGVRLGELCRMQVQDLDKDGSLVVRPFGSSRKSRPRMVYLGQRARFHVWRYLASREDLRPEDAIIPLAPDRIRALLYSLGQRAGVNDVHPHRFRHTFALEYLRNGGDVFTLQRLLGHSTLDMVQHYIAIVETDKRNAHRAASPMDKWRI
ncbi:site-specific recombinase XerD [Longilinea arvoryzae]|uniref:Site-specific recombinase XerD n=1 Tax=Longilinea arvoryzae TaxID=360412 RepID=A0A0S7BAX7_9CHLR|nr:tyrosine-type recombinase/integrase [Longilinea arvoryzae]GAP14879.1 site-specific recombinase XerD [Longilinea arvoryzae]